MTLKQAQEKAREGFIGLYCVKRPSQPIRWIRSVFFDEHDKIEKILEYIDEATKQIYEDVVHEVEEKIQTTLEKYEDKGDERHGWVKHNNTILQRIEDDLLDKLKSDV